MRSVHLPSDNKAHVLIYVVVLMILLYVVSKLALYIIDREQTVHIGAVTTTANDKKGGHD